MELLQAPEGDVVATHPATLFARILAVLMMMVPGAALIAVGAQLSPADATKQMPLFAGGGALLALGILAIVQQNRSKVVVRTDGIERWGLRGKLWALRWPEMAELRYRAVKMRLYHVIPVGTNIYLTLTDPQGRKRRHRKHEVVGQLVGHQPREDDASSRNRSGGGLGPARQGRRDEDFQKARPELVQDCSGRPRTRREVPRVRRRQRGRDSQRVPLPAPARRPRGAADVDPPGSRVLGPGQRWLTR